MINDPSHWPLG